MKRSFIWIDIFRLILAFLVVGIHVKCGLTPYIAWLFPVAVPGFFAISGFLMWEKPVESYNRALRKVSIATLVAFVLFLPVYVLLFQDHDWREVSTWVNMLVFNEPFESEHLWYLLAYLYVLVIARWVYARVENIHIIVFLFFAILLLGGNVWLRYSGLQGYWWRNWLMTGVPYFSLGLALRTLYEGHGWKFLEVDPQQHTWLARVAGWGARYTLDIYILHPLIYIVCGYTLCYFFLFRAAMWWFGPVVIFLLTWGVSIVRHLLLIAVRK